MKEEKYIKVHIDKRSFDDSANDATIDKFNNKIVTSKYTFYNFLPKILFEQFQKKSNIYFLIIAIMQTIDSISISNGKPVIVFPLFSVICISGIKDFYEDYQRNKSDKEENNKSTLLFNKLQNKFIPTTWESLMPGDIIRIKENEYIPADIILTKCFNNSDDFESLDTNSNSEFCYIETKNLDGETNLKTKHIIKLPSNYNYFDIKSNEDFYKTYLSLEHSNEIMSKFSGKIVINNDNNHYNLNLTYDSFIPRGCSIRLTKCIEAVVCYTGHSTKIMKNSPMTKYKVSSVENIMMNMITLIFITQVSLALLGSIVNFTFASKDHKRGFISKLFSLTGTWILIFTNFVPISLLVSLEMIKYFQGYFISWDATIYDRINKKGAVVQTSTLNEELGMVKYIFTDKTGTLTQNKMVFKSFCVSDKVYFKVINSKNKMSQYMDIDEIDAKNIKDEMKSFYSNLEYYYDINIESAIHLLDLHLKVLAINHSIINKSLFKIDYISSSPDEKCLIHVAENLDFVFLSEVSNLTCINEVLKYYNLKLMVDDFNNIYKNEMLSNKFILIKSNGYLLVFQNLITVNYNSERKRMSILVKDLQSGRYILLVKGADSVISERVAIKDQGSNLEKILFNMKNYAKQGLRTLMTAFRLFNNKNCENLLDKYYKLTNQQNKEDLSELINELENDLIPLGVTAIDDMLQDDVKSTISDFTDVGIKVWMLTGDKSDTAKAIGYNCGLISDNTNLIEITEDTTSLSNLKSSLEKNLEQQDNKINFRASGNDYKSNNNNSFLNEKLLDNSEVNVEKKENDLKENKKTCLIISGNFLDKIFFDSEDIENQNLYVLFKKLSLRCNTVICSRVSPKQKAQVVKITNKVSLAIGDGANDVNMITTANIGVGIEGEEGGQAARSSDYSISQFSYLKRLLFYHGRESYRKNTYVVCYNFYKNVVFVIPQFFFGINSMFSGQTLYDPYIYQLYNMVFTILPIIWYGVYDLQLTSEELMNNGAYYKQGMANKLFTKKRFWLHVLYGFFEAFIIYLFCFSIEFYSENGLNENLWSLGLVAYGSIVLIVNTKLIASTTSFVWINFVLYILSNVSFVIIIIVMNKSRKFEIFNCVDMISNIFLILLIFFIAISLILFEKGIKHLTIVYKFRKSHTTLEMDKYFLKEIYEEDKKMEKLEIDKSKEKTNISSKEVEMNCKSILI